MLTLDFISMDRCRGLAMTVPDTPYLCRSQNHQAQKIAAAMTKRPTIEPATIAAVETTLCPAAVLSAGEDWEVGEEGPVLGETDCCAAETEDSD